MRETEGSRGRGKIKQMQDARIQDAGSTLWESFPAAILTGGSASVVFNPASWILYPESGFEIALTIEHPVSSIAGSRSRRTNS
jgi:hypothetical protein